MLLWFISILPLYCYIIIHLVRLTFNFLNDRVFDGPLRMRWIFFKKRIFGAPVRRQIDYRKGIISRIIDSCQC